MSESISRSRVRRAAPLIALFLLCVFFRGVGMEGLDFGYHWDEHFHQKDLKNAVSKGDLLSRKYVYNGLYYWPAVVEHADLFVDAWPSIEQQAKLFTGNVFELSSTEAGRKLQKDFGDAILADDHLLAVRSMYLHICMTALLAAFLFSSAVTRSRWVGVGAAALVATCWEFGYHARWYAVDSILATFALWVCASLARALTARTDVARLLWMIASAIFAGLAVGSKITGGTAVVVVCMVVPFLPPYAGYASGVRRLGMAAVLLAVACFVCATTFVTTTPGFLVDPLRFVADIAAARIPYAVPHGGVHGVVNRSHMLWALAYWMVGGGTWSVVGVVVALLGFAGILALLRVRDTRALGVALIAFLVVHFLGTTGASKFIVRNQLNPLMVLVLCAPLGLAAVLRRWPSTTRVVVCVCALVFVAQGTHAVWAARSVVTTTRETILDDAQARIGATGAWVTPKVVDALGPRVTCDEARTIPASDLSPTVLFFHEEFEDKWYPGNGPSIGDHLTSFEVNYNWYGSWVGKHKDDHIIVTTKDAIVAALQLRTLPMRRCVAKATAR
jgi:hypothetical protein